MSERISKSDLAIREERVNDLFKALGSKLGLKVGYRYNYVAIDLLKDDKIWGTLISGLTKREAYDILCSIERILAELNIEKRVG
jgi:hypothetical protein